MPAIYSAAAVGGVEYFGFHPRDCFRDAGVWGFEAAGLLLVWIDILIYFLEGEKYSQAATSGFERKRKSFSASELRAVSESKLNGRRMRFSV